LLFGLTWITNKPSNVFRKITGQLASILIKTLLGRSQTKLFELQKRDGSDETFQVTHLIH
jgi:hypothetical protein